VERQAAQELWRQLQGQASSAPASEAEAEAEERADSAARQAQIDALGSAGLGMPGERQDDESSSGACRRGPSSPLRLTSLCLVWEVHMVATIMPVGCRRVVMAAPPLATGSSVSGVARRGSASDGPAEPPRPSDRYLYQPEAELGVAAELESDEREARRPSPPPPPSSSRFGPYLRHPLGG
jgi:hypothetical protein